MFKMSVTPILCIPIMGFVFTIGTSLYAWYCLWIHPKKTRIQRLYESFLLLLHTGFNWSAYAIWITQAAIMTPLGGGLFVAASIIDVLKELIALTHGILTHRREGVFHKTALNLAYYKMHRNAALINLLVASLMLAVMAVWCFVPGGLVVVLPCMAAVSVLYLFKHIALKKNEKTQKKIISDLKVYFKDAGGSAKEATALVEMILLPKPYHYPSPVAENGSDENALENEEDVLEGTASLEFT